ncbi:visgun [Carabus blaptoides fortunei]
MNLNIVHILVIVFISGVIGLNNTKLSLNDSEPIITNGKNVSVVAAVTPVHAVDPIIINGKNASDVPEFTTVNSSSPIPSTIIPPQPPTIPPSTTITPPTTTTTITPPITTSTEKPTTTTTEPTTPATTVPPTNVTTTTQSTTTTTTATTTTTTAVPAHKGRHFDGPSFIGGIILASGLMAIGFVSWKFYKARTERNYHTL